MRANRGASGSWYRDELCRGDGDYEARLGRSDRLGRGEPRFRGLSACTRTVGDGRKVRRVTPTMKIQLVRPSERYRESFLAGLREFRHEGLPWHVAVDLEAVER